MQIGARRVTRIGRTARPQSAGFRPPQRARPAARAPVHTMVWALDCGVLHVGSDGLGLRPQMKLGYTGNTMQLAVGLGDVRDGIYAVCMAQLRRVYEAEGDSIAEVLKKLRPSNSAPRLPSLGLGNITKIFNLSNIAFDWLIKAAPWLLGRIISITGVDIPKGSRVRARAAIKSGLGADAGVCLGWTDTKGYRMVGLQGQVGVIAKLGFNLLAGLHQDRRRVKAIIGYSNVVVELEFTLPSDAEECDAGVGEDEDHGQMALERKEAEREAERAGAAVEVTPSAAAAGGERRHWGHSWTLLMTALVLGGTWRLVGLLMGGWGRMENRFLFDPAARLDPVGGTR